MNAIEKWIHLLSPLITAFATVVLTVVTIVYVSLLYNQTALQQDPILKVNPGDWHIRGEKPGIFEMALHNTGVSDVDNIRIFEDYFVPAQDDLLVLYRVGIYTVREDTKIDSLEKGKRATFKIEFDHLLDQMQEILKTKKGKQYRIFRIKIKYDRRIDKKEFELNQIYIIAGHGDILISEDERDSIDLESIPIREIKRILGM